MSTARNDMGRPDAAPFEADRHMRSDARRNRERVLEATGDLMAVHGVDVSVDEIAQLARVGVGTVYRNFPTKGALFQALLVARIEPLVVAAREAMHAEDPGDAFTTFVRRVSDEFASFKALADAMVESGVDIDVAKREISGGLVGAVGDLLARAQQAGRIRPDVTVNDVSAMMAGLSHADPSFMDPSQRSRCVALVCDSLLVGARCMLPQRPPSARASTAAGGGRA